MIKIIGIGGAGLNMINTVIDAGFEPENAVYIDTSRNAVWAAKTDNFLELGTNIFKGCGSGKNQNGKRRNPDGVNKIGKGVFDGCNKLVIKGYSDSYAEKYAKENDIPFEAI